MWRSGEQLGSGALAKLRAIKATPAGQTGLYDSTAYKIAAHGMEPVRLNVVVVMTDGKNKDPAGSGSRQALRPEAADPTIGIGIGPDTDEPELQQITKPAGGKAFVAKDPGRITDVLFGALSRLTGAA